MCFKIFDYQVTMTESKSSLWSFLTFSPKSNKKYAVFCTPTVSKVSGLIKVALKKLPNEHRLVVVTVKHTKEELKTAEEQDYCLVSYKTLNEYGEQMLELKNGEIPSTKPTLGLVRESNENENEEDSPSNFIDKVITKDRLF
jgi:hypothetical protein